MGESMHQIQEKIDLCANIITLGKNPFRTSWDFGRNA